MNEEFKEKGDADRLQLQIRGGRTKRYHTFDTIMPQTVGEHTYGVVQIVRYLTEPSKDLLMAALDHDVAEIVVGDAPFMAKRNSPNIKNAYHVAESIVVDDYKLTSYEDLTVVEQRILKAADLLEMGYFGIREIRMGNSDAETIVQNVLTALDKILVPSVPRIKTATANLRRLLNASQ